MKYCPLSVKSSFIPAVRSTAAHALLPLALVAAAYAAYGAPSRSKGVPKGWIEDFAEAKAVATQENKRILMCSVASDTHFGKRMYNEVYSKSKFTGNLKKRFVLMMVDTANDSKNLSRVALAQNIDLRSRYRMWGSGNCCVVDKDGGSLKHFSIEGDALLCLMRVEIATRDIPPPLPVNQAEADGRAPVRQPSTATTPAPAPVRSMTPGAHLREGNRLAVAGKWNEALEHFRKSEGRIARMAEYEAAGKPVTIKLADAWWLAASNASDAKVRLAYQSHAAHLYMMALARGGLSTDDTEKAVGKVNALYCVIDLSGGPDVTFYPVSYFSDVPKGGWGDEYKTTKLVLRRIPAGTFIMGGDQGNESHRVAITKPFYIGVFEVTQKQYELVTGKNPAEYKGAMRPVENVSYDNVRGKSKGSQWPFSSDVDADSFIGKLRARTLIDTFDLPTSAQWEYACRAGTTSVYNNGGDTEDDLRKVARYNDTGGSDEKHATVGSYAPNGWGLYDMLGNVWEWCLDWRGPLSFGTDPVGPDSGSTQHVQRGGSWKAGKGCESASRSAVFHGHGYNFLGFRVCASIGTMRLAVDGARPAALPAQPSSPAKAVPALAFPDVTKGQYCVIDLSAGPNASSYPVSYMSSAPTGGWSDEYKTTKLVLRKIPTGTFIMGWNPHDESRRVNITQPFYMGVFEVTQKQYELVTGGNPSFYKGDMRPVNQVSFNEMRGNAKKYNWPKMKAVDADSFIGRIRARTGLNIDLPPETEWEYACRAGTASRFNNGGDGADDWVKVGRVPPNQSAPAWFEPKKYRYDHRPDGKGGYYAYCTVVGMYLPNAWGLYDMHGNLWELTLEWAPLGARDGKDKVMRGGCWDSPIDHCMSCSYRKQNPDNGGHHIGIRLFISATGESQHPRHRERQGQRIDSASVMTPRSIGVTCTET